MLKVLITTNIPSPYFVDYANELTKYVDLTVVFELKSASDRDKSWQRIHGAFKFNYVFLNARKTGNDCGISFKIKKYLKGRSFDRIIIANPTTPTGIIALLYLRKHNLPFIIQSEGGFRGSGKGFKERLKKYLMEKAEFYLTGMGGNDDYFISYGAIDSKLKKYNFTSLFNKDIETAVLNKNEKLLLRKKLGINQKYMLLYVGQFIDRKNIPCLLDAYKLLNTDDYCLVLVGGFPTKEYKTLEKKLELKNVIYVPFISKQEMTDYYKAADVFVLPTNEDTWGLVINEAMARGLPIVSTNRSIAATQLIENGVNGFLCDANDSVVMSKCINAIIKDERMIKQISINNLNKIKEYTIEKMAFDIFNYLNDFRQ